MSVKQRLVRRVVLQFRDPIGPGGYVAGWVMGRRSSNVQRNRWAVSLLNVAPTDRALELGCGPGVALAALAARAARGLVVGVDHSAVMLRQARRRNAAAVAAGRVRLIHAPVEGLHVPGGPFDVALAVNTVGFWPEPTVQLRDIGRVLRPGGRIALVSQPRCPGATAASSAAAAAELAVMLSHAGFEGLRFETLQLDPPAACVLATWPVSSPRDARPSPGVSPKVMAKPDARNGPGPLVRAIGRIVNSSVVRWPWSWSLLRRPVRTFFDTVAAGWDERARPDSPEHLLPLRAALDRLEASPARILDIGTGTGAAAFDLADRYPDAEVVGIDVSGEMVAQAAAKAADLGSRVRFVLADIASFDDEDGFDLMVMLNMPPFFDRMVALLRPGGVVVNASSYGARTPFFTPPGLLQRGFERRGLRTLAAKQVGPGTYYLAEQA